MTNEQEVDDDEDEDEEEDLTSSVENYQERTNSSKLQGRHRGKKLATGYQLNPSNSELSHNEN